MYGGYGGYGGGGAQSNYRPIYEPIRTYFPQFDQNRDGTITETGIE